MIHCYRLGGYNIVIDVVSGSIHSVDDVAFDVISMYERENREEIEKHIKRKFTEIDDAGLADIFTDIDQLINQGKLFSLDTFEHVKEHTRNKPLKALCLNVSHACNMSCFYCFAGNGKYGGAGELMSFETGKRAIDFLVESSAGRKNLDIDFFGGEPLLNWNVIKDIVRYARSIEQESIKKFRFTLTTNGLLIDDDVTSFTNKEMHNVVLSLDGRPETNDATRKLPDGTGSYNNVVPKFRKIVQARGGKGYYIRGTFTRDNLDFVNDILHIADIGFGELSMEPVVTKPGTPYGLTMDDLPMLDKQYELLALEMIKRKKEGRGFTFYHYILNLPEGPCVHKRLAGCGVGSEYLAVTPGGELYPCHQFVGDRNFLMGDVWQGVVNKKLLDEFAVCDIYTRSECRECWARMYCSGGCAANAYNATDSIGGVYKLGCEMFKKRIECAVMIKVSECVSDDCE